MGEKIKEAFVRLRELKQAMLAVPVLNIRDISPLRDSFDIRDGLRELEFPSSLTILPRDSSGDNRLRSKPDEVPPERDVVEFIDLAALTPDVVAKLQQRELAAAKAVDLAESLCNDLLNEACRK